MKLRFISYKTHGWLDGDWFECGSSLQLICDVDNSGFYAEEVRRWFKKWVFK